MGARARIVSAWTGYGDREYIDGTILLVILPGAGSASVMVLPMTDPTPIDVPEQLTGADRHRAIVRLVAGGVGEGVDRLMTLAASLDEADVDPDSAETGPIHADPTVMAVLGWVSEVPDQLKAITDSTSRATYPIARSAEVAWDTAAFVARATGVQAFVEGFTEPFLVAWQEERERLTAVGTAEYARGRVLAVEVFEQTVGGVMGFIGESDELGDLVREQTLGITGSAVREIRETGAAADGLTEGIFRRLLGRNARSVPPRPAAASE
jgi:hypothetical protein